MKFFQSPVLLQRAFLVYLILYQRPIIQQTGCMLFANVVCKI